MKILISFYLLLNAAIAFIHVPSASDSKLQLQTFSSTHHQSTEFKVVVWNILKGKRNSFEKDFEKILNENDFILIQEMMTNEVITQTLTPNFGASMGVSFIYEQNNIATGTAIASRYSPQDFGVFKSFARESLTNTPKTITWAKFKIHNQEVLLINVHSLLSVPAGSFNQQLSQMDLLLTRHLGPVVMAGDFNTWNRRRMRKLRSFARSHGLIEVEFPNGDERRPVMRNGNFLDHSFIRNLELINSQILESINSSDHRPISLYLKLNQ